VNVRVQPRPEARKLSPRQPGQARAAARREAQPHPPVLDDQRPQHRQLVLLMDDRLPQTLLAAVELCPHPQRARRCSRLFIQALGRGQFPRLALMTGVTAGLAHRALVGLERRTATLGL
jgi:hypothetical protein